MNWFSDEGKRKSSTWHLVQNWEFKNEKKWNCELKIIGGQK